MESNNHNFSIKDARADIIDKTLRLEHLINLLIMSHFFKINNNQRDNKLGIEFLTDFLENTNCLTLRKKVELFANIFFPKNSDNKNMIIKLIEIRNKFAHNDQRLKIATEKGWIPYKEINFQKLYIEFKSIYPEIDKQIMNLINKVPEIKKS
jgi:hypothetical protein